MHLRLSKPTPAFFVATAALLVSLGGTSYAVSQIGSSDIADDSVRSVDVRNDSLRSADVENDSLRSIDIKDGTLRSSDFRDGTLLQGERGARGPQGPRGPEGDQGPAGVGRWLLVDAAGVIVDQSGGFEILTAYDLVNNSGAAVPGGALGNVYIDANEDLSDNGIVVSIALQNQVDQNADGVRNGRAVGPDANPEFSGEISATMCGIAGVVACAPSGADNMEHFVVSPRLSDGQVTDSTNRKRFYVIISGDSSDYTPAG